MGQGDHRFVTARGADPALGPAVFEQPPRAQYLDESIQSVAPVPDPLPFCSAS